MAWLAAFIVTVLLKPPLDIYFIKLGISVHDSLIKK